MSTIVFAAQHPTCTAPALSEQEIQVIVDKERQTDAGKDLPRRAPTDQWTVRRHGCHYVYVESAVPARPEGANVFWMNQYGALIDASPGAMTCPTPALTEQQLAKIVSTERGRRSDLAPPAPNANVRVSRLRCLYVYIEFAGSLSSTYQAFTIDPFGEVIDAFW
jgi:hypothetical protein